MSLYVIIISVAILLISIEKLFPGADLPDTPIWWIRALSFNGAQAIISYVGVITWDKWFLSNSFINVSNLSDEIQILVGYLAITFIYYWWHRARHEIPFLWNTFHQIHHSPGRLEVITSFYKHPLEIILNGLLSSWILHSLLGISPGVAATIVLITGIAELLYHWNISTPHWLGYLFQRPESHRVHHQYGLHKFNYSDLPIWDMCFGTFHNPKISPEKTGFHLGQEMQLKKMLLCKSATKRGEL